MRLIKCTTLVYSFVCLNRCLTSQSTAMVMRACCLHFMGLLGHHFLIYWFTRNFSKKLSRGVEIKIKIKLPKLQSRKVKKNKKVVANLFFFFFFFFFFFIFFFFFYFIFLTQAHCKVCFHVQNHCTRSIKDECYVSLAGFSLRVLN